jgi:hypothetical protein
MDNQPRQKSEPQRALRLALTEPAVVQIAPAQYRQAVDLLASVIVDFVERDRSECDHD